MDSVGALIRKKRQEMGYPLRTVAEYLDVDQAILSKIERGQRNASRAQIVKLAGFFRMAVNDLLVPWLSDKLVSEVADEDVALKALKIAEEKVIYQTIATPGISTIIRKITEVLEKDGRVTAAWLFGSMVKGEIHPGSDVDIMIELNQQRNYSMFDLMDIAHSIEQRINRKVDLVEKGQLHDFAWADVSQNLKKIYG